MTQQIIDGDRYEKIVVRAAPDERLPVDVGGATVNIQGDVTVSNEVEITNDDNNPIPISDAGGSITVDGPLTDAELRASAVPVSAAALPLPAGASTEAKQDTLIAAVDGVEGLLTTIDTDTGSIDAKLPALSGGAVPVTGPLTDTQLRATAVPVSAASLPLPTGAATSAKQDTGNTSLASIDGKLPALSSGRVPVDIGAISLGDVEIKNDSGNPVPVTGPLTDTQLRASAVPVAPNISRGTGTMDSNTTRVTLATDGPGLANLSSIAGLSIPAHDYIALTYTGTNLTGVVYKTGGANGTTVGTLTLAYSGSQLTSVTKS